MQPDILRFFAAFFEKELGIVYAEHNYFQLEARLEEVAKTQGLQGVDELFQVAQKSLSGMLRQLLLDVATNNETSFFRDQPVFRALEQVVIPGLCQTGDSPKSLKIWSAACSYGQEPFSLAILLTEFQKKFPGKILDFEILATDVSERALSRAQTGKYSQLEIQRGLPTPLLLKYFQKDKDDYWILNSNLLSKVSFLKQNLKQTFAIHESFDLVLCRNILIYQKVESKIEILKKFTPVLKPDGYFILGAGESLIGLSEDFEQVLTENCVIYRLKPGSR